MVPKKEKVFVNTMEISITRDILKTIKDMDWVLYITTNK